MKVQVSVHNLHYYDTVLQQHLIGNISHVSLDMHLGHTKYMSV